jgi:hypothetical protein
MQKVDDVDTLQLIDNVDQSIVESQALADTRAVMLRGLSRMSVSRLMLTLMTSLISFP